MLVKAKTSFIGTFGNLSIGEVKEVSDQVGKDLIRASLAEEYVEKKAAEKQPKSTEKKAEDKVNSKKSKKVGEAIEN